MKLFVAMLLPLIAGTAIAQRVASLPAGTVVDLSHPFDATTVYWPTAEPFKLEKDFEGMTDKGYYYSAYRYSSAEHGGTHIDAPVHFAKGRHSVDAIPLSQTIGPAIVVDVTKQVEKNRDYQVTENDSEIGNGEMAESAIGAIVLLRTGFGKFYPDRKKYLGTDQRGEKLSLTCTFPDCIQTPRDG